MLRHSCVTHLLRRGAPLEAIRKLLGHQGLASTQVYLHLTPEDVRTALKRHSIRRTWSRVWATAVSRTRTCQGAPRGEIPTSRPMISVRADVPIQGTNPVSPHLICMA